MELVPTVLAFVIDRPIHDMGIAAVRADDHGVSREVIGRRSAPRLDRDLQTVYPIDSAAVINHVPGTEFCETEEAGARNHRGIVSRSARVRDPGKQRHRREVVPGEEGLAREIPIRVEIVVGRRE